MAGPAFFPAAYPAFPPEIQCYRGLFVSRGAAWEPVRGRPGHHVYRALPNHLELYDAEAEYPELWRSNFPFYWAGLWFLNDRGAWQLHRGWSNYARDVGGAADWQQASADYQEAKQWGVLLAAVFAAAVLYDASKGK